MVSRRREWTECDLCGAEITGSQGATEKRREVVRKIRMEEYQSEEEGSILSDLCPVCQDKLMVVIKERMKIGGNRVSAGG